VRRREFIAALGGAAALPFPVRAQDRERVRRVAAFNSLPADDPEAQVRHSAFLQGLQEFGWAIGRNLRLDTRWGAGDANRIRSIAAELSAQPPDVIFCTGGVTVAPLLQLTRTAPIVFVIVPDPVGSGFVESLARPGGNATGFLMLEFGLSGKWLEVLKEISPAITRAAVLRDPTVSSVVAQLGAIQTVAPSLGVDVSPINARDAREIERVMGGFARVSNGGLVVAAGPSAAIHRDLIVKLAAHHKLPAVYYERNFAAAGGLISYGPDFIDQYRRAAGYVDRILRGEKPADLPVQAPTKYELVVNLKTAKALGLDVPWFLQQRADEVIE